ncbi:Minichromosome maintenance protein MCM [Candidatus Gugararchaeum adminiculabundum]|nr:Minichromosome maintenance protein MCM [Candidatus Gugararchaeum adminiculabundum]
MAMEEVSQVESVFEEFLEKYCKKGLDELALNYPRKKGLIVDYLDLEKFNMELADELLKSPDKIIDAAKEAIKKLNITVNLLDRKEKEEFEPHVRFMNLPYSGLLIESVGSHHIEKLIRVEGIVTKRAEVKPKVRIAVYVCQLCDAKHKIAMTKNAIAPVICDDCKRRSLKMVEEESYFVDLQRAEVQELLERAKSGAPTGHLELWIEDDLVNTYVPGDRVILSGILRLKPPEKGKNPNVYSKYLEVNYLQKEQNDFEDLELSAEEERKIIELSKSPRLFDIISKSVAPGIYGHEEVKQAIALQLFGGTHDKVLPDGSRIRHDIHVLLVGDPGAAKTRILQYTRDISPKSVYVSGKSVSAAGLTASAEKDPLSDGGWTLKAGALVLASGGLACVDEFDKIGEEDTASMHEVMESQTVSVAKAGIVATFRARTSILAAANPEYGRFDPYKLPSEQFNIPPTLLSRFDLIFVIRDVLDAERDTMMAEHILASHESASKRAAEGRTLSKSDWQGDVGEMNPAFLRQYIAYARKHIRPVLTQEAKTRIRDYYVDLRKIGAQQGAVPITPRAIEGLIRLAEASAKMRLSERVESVDAERSIGLLNFMLHTIMVDKETNRIDGDIVATGTPKSQVDKINTILGIIRELAKEFDEVSIAQVIEKCGDYGIDSVKANRIVDDLIHKGELYKPKPNFVKLVRGYGE